MNTLGRRQNSFGRDLCDGGLAGNRVLDSNNPTPTFCTLPRDSKTCEVLRLNKCCWDFLFVGPLFRNGETSRKWKDINFLNHIIWKLFWIGSIIRNKKYKLKDLENFWKFTRCILQQAEHISFSEIICIWLQEVEGDGVGSAFVPINSLTRCNVSGAPDYPHSSALVTPPTIIPCSTDRNGSLHCQQSSQIVFQYSHNTVTT